MATPTNYQFDGKNVHVDYLTIQSGPIIEGEQPPFVTYRNSSETLKFFGSQVQTVETQAGQIVSVVIGRKDRPDGSDETRTFSFVVPRVNLADASSSSEPVHTVGINGVHKNVLAPGTFDNGLGQLDDDTAVTLTGTASQSDIHPDTSA